MPRKQKAALVPTPIKQSHKAMVVSYRPQTLHDTIHTVLPGEVLPAIPSYSEFIAVRLFVFQLTASRRDWRRSTPRQPTSAAFQLTASRRGWRLGNHLTVWREKYFNSQPHEEADGQGSANVWYHASISTHSLTKRLTSLMEVGGTVKRYFNSQPHEEADSASWLSTVSGTIFQLTASRRGWRITVHPSLNLITYFNSQPHEEADLMLCSPFLRCSISTHSLTKRLTAVWIPLDSLNTFQLTASRRGWQLLPEVISPLNSISTHSLTKRLTRAFI